MHDRTTMLPVIDCIFGDQIWPIWLSQGDRHAAERQLVSQPQTSGADLAPGRAEVACQTALRSSFQRLDQTLRKRQSHHLV